MTLSTTHSIIRYSTLENQQDRLHAEYRHADPFPHIMLDNFLEADAVEAIYKSFPPVNETFYAAVHKNSFKYANSELSTFPEPIKSFFEEIHSTRFMKLVEHITGISELKVDWGLRGGGMHQSVSGGFLNVHADFTHHKELKLRRALNILLYLNKDWKESYNGYLELWDRQMKHCVKAIAPLYNRCVMFSTDDLSYHGHPIPLKLPDGMARRSLAAYYYTDWKENDRVEAVITTAYQPLPHEYRKRFVRFVKSTLKPILKPFLKK